MCSVDPDKFELAQTWQPPTQQDIANGADHLMNPAHWFVPFRAENVFDHMMA